VVTLAAAGHTGCLSCQADSLKSLCTTHEKDIMGFLVRLSKQERLAHVWLATSCWSFSAWVEKGERQYIGRWAREWLPRADQTGHHTAGFALLLSP
jgi:hypothetical protein